MRRAILTGALALAAGCATTREGGLGEGTDPIRLRKQVAATLLARRAWAPAVQPLRDLARVVPKDTDVRVMLATAYREQGLFEEAEREFAEALSLDGKRADAFNGRGILRDLRGDPGDAAIDDLKKATELQPNNPAYYNNLGFALFVRGRDLDAVEAYRKGLQRDPTARRMRNNLGFAYGRLGQFHHAKREFYRAGAAAEAENNLGFAYEQSGDLVAACDRYREAARLAPGLVVVKANLSRACGSTEAALRVSERSPTEPPADRAITEGTTSKASHKRRSE